MPTYTIHTPPPKPGAVAGNPDRFVFVRDGFHFWAFALGPLWLLLHRLWLAFAFYIIGYALVGVGLALVRASTNMQILVWLLIAVLIGLEAPSIWRWTLTRRGWSTVGFLVAENAEMAEQRFFAQWVQRTANTPAVTLASKHSVPMRPLSGSDVIGLFPEPGGQR